MPPPSKVQSSFESDLQKKIVNAFEIFDQDGTRIVDIREIGTIMRSLGCCLSEADLQDILVELEDEDSPGYVNLDTFLPMMMKFLLDQRFHPASSNKLLQAFQMFDVDKKGYLTQAELTHLLTQEGECFTQDEMEEMLSAAVDPQSGHINYKEYISHLVSENL
ncbi:dynein regulatory complex protein 8-like isoform X1 [Tachypleus tridentatus]|uniref:dynein regulatory complex protein 8-like isoform X1 n=1 Tax=Tachypleus tridentatus TaxID=6853 RepID=UPI003FD3A48A